ncbi:hypothetical protein CPC16_001600 [Podila verticillata]|nr:hypothetical protein BGZ52_008474 [Haplosporangium bisporale]KAF9393610.1 hypothetical protein CPC16_001600 [Podila verticillata]
MLDSGCAGFPLGYPSRSDVDINTKYTYLVQDRRPDASVCQPGRQNIPGNNPFQPANVVPGQNLHLTWQPDGHLDDNQPSTVEIHWSGVPDKQIHTRSELNPSTLLSTMIFATKNNCDQASEPNTWCHGHVTIPPSTQPGTYQMIWWWKYDRNPSGEEYSTCFEIVVGGPNGSILRRGFSSSPKAEKQRRALAQASAPAPASVSAPLEASYMSKDAVSVPNKEIQQPPQPTTDGYDKLPQKATLADLATKADEPLSVIPTVGSNQNGNQELLKGYDYINDEQGALAGDAINTEQDKDSTPGPLTTPSQVIQGTLNSTLSFVHNRTAVASGNSTSTNNSTLVQSTPGAGNVTVSIPGFRPQTGHNSNLAGNPIASSAMGATSIATAAVISGALVVSFMMV